MREKDRYGTNNVVIAWIAWGCTELILAGYRKMAERSEDGNIHIRTNGSAGLMEQVAVARLIFIKSGLRVPRSYINPSFQDRVSFWNPVIEGFNRVPLPPAVSILSLLGGQGGCSVLDDRRCS